jgi:hypothetical protein
METRQQKTRILTFADALKVFATLEMRICDFYERLAEMFDEDSDISEFWLQMAGDEMEHADALRSAAESLPESILVTSSQPVIERAMIRKLFRAVQICEQTMTRHEGSLDAAFQCALFLESSEISDIYRWLLDRIPLLWTDPLSALTETSGHIINLCEVIEGGAQDSKLRERAGELRRQLEEYGFRRYIAVHKSKRVRGRLEEDLMEENGGVL